MSVQGVMNTRLQEHVGLWEANAYVQGTAFALSLVVMWLFGTGNLGALASAPRGYLLGGALGPGDYRNGDAGHQGAERNGSGVGHSDRTAAGGGGHRRTWLDGTGKGAHGTLAVRRAGADAGRRGAVQVSLTSASSPFEQDGGHVAELVDRFAQRGEGIAYLLTAGQLGIVGLNDGIDVVKHAVWVIQTARFLHTCPRSGR